MDLFLQMVYMLVEKHTPDLLHLKRSPGIRSWSLFVGMNVGEVDIVQLLTRSYLSSIHILYTYPLYINSIHILYT